MVIQHSGLLMVAMLCLLFDLQPADLETVAHQLAEFDAINDSKTEIHKCYE